MAREKWRTGRNTRALTKAWRNASGEPACFCVFRRSFVSCWNQRLLAVCILREKLIHCRKKESSRPFWWQQDQTISSRSRSGFDRRLIGRCSRLLWKWRRYVGSWRRGRRESQRRRGLCNCFYWSSCWLVLVAFMKLEGLMALPPKSPR